MSSKNTLQELYQKDGKLPTYSTIQAGGEDHAPVFISTVTLPTGETFTGSGSKKRLAEIEAAKVALASMEKTEEKFMIIEHCLDQVETVFLIDLENIHKLPDFDYPREAPIGFLSTFSHKASQTFPFTVHKIDSSAKEAADHCMSFMSGLLAGYFNTTRPDRKPKFVILSRDQSSANLRAMFYKFGFDADIRVE